MPAPDARTRNKISLNPSKVLSTSIHNSQLPWIFGANVLFVTSLYAGKEWLLDFDVGVFWVAMRILACGGIGALIWEGLTGQFAKRRTIEWSVLGMSSLLLFVQQACLFTALYRLSTTRVILFTHFSTLWIAAIISPVSAKKTMAISVALILSFLSDAHFSTDNFSRLMPAYAALTVYAVSSSALDHTYGVLSPSLGSTFTIAASTLGASILALPFYIFRTVILKFPSTPALPLFSLAAIPLLAYSILFLSPATARSPQIRASGPQYFALSYPFTFIFSALVGPSVFSQHPSWTDFLIASMLCYGMYPNSFEALEGSPRTPAARLIRSYLKTIVANPESRKIFYFLLLNMCYMLVQMLYGVWTNSLGLISDAIHMAFDCMAIGVGLFASVMATWEPNERFTYGYGRIETLSGFANGIFLILISVFIVFEAIQRLMEPPEMNTSQLLLVSSLGLAVNLFGMFAMGGHHHGGHSHSHGSSHSHEESHSHTSPTKSHEFEHEQSHSPPHSHSQPHAADEPAHSPPAHSHSYSHAPVDGDHSHCTNHETESHLANKTPSRQYHGPAIHTHHNDDLHDHKHDPSSSSLPQDLLSPITPSYHFGHDDHFKTHHESGHAPNLHNHSHVPDHSQEGHSHNMRGVFLHVMADTLGSVGVIISTLLIQFYGWTGFDPIASLFIATLIAVSVVPLVVDTGKVLCLDVADSESSILKALSELSSIEGLASYTFPRFWPKDSSSLIGSIHVQLAPSTASYDPTGPHSTRGITYTRLDRVVERVDTLLRGRISGLEELTIQVEEGKYSS